MANFEKNLKKTLEKKKELANNWYILPKKTIFGSKVLCLDFDHQEYYKRTDVIKIAQKISNDLYKDKKNALLGISVKYSKIKWRSGYLTEVGDPVNLFNPEDSDLNEDIGIITKFKITMISKPHTDLEKLDKSRKLRELKKISNK